jgi:hypothetical protein
MASYLPRASIFALVCSFSFPSLSFSKPSVCPAKICLALLRYGSAFWFSTSLRISWVLRRSLPSEHGSANRALAGRESAAMSDKRDRHSR